MSTSIGSAQSWRSSLLAGVLAALVLSSLGCLGKSTSVNAVRQRTPRENLELALACKWDPDRDELAACLHFEQWLREADALCVEEQDGSRSPPVPVDGDTLDQP